MTTAKSTIPVKLALRDSLESSVRAVYCRSVADIFPLTVKTTNILLRRDSEAVNLDFRHYEFCIDVFRQLFCGVFPAPRSLLFWLPTVPGIDSPTRPPSSRRETWSAPNHSTPCSRMLFVAAVYSSFSMRRY